MDPIDVFLQRSQSYLNPPTTFENDPTSSLNLYVSEGKNRALWILYNIKKSHSEVGFLILSNTINFGYSVSVFSDLTSVLYSSLIFFNLVFQMIKDSLCLFMLS